MLIQQRTGNLADDPLNNLVKDYLVGKKDLVGIEIGSYRGESTEIFYKSGAFKTLYAIDPWLPGYDPKDICADNTIVLAEKYFDERFKDNNTVLKIKMKAEDAINLFSDESIDFIYIDGCHTYDAVTKDLTNYVPKIKKGGIIAGHDWHWEVVKKAILDFFPTEPLKIYPEHSWIYIKD